jgi:hypothetical protein
MAYFLVRCEDSAYANLELYRDVVAGGERSFCKRLAAGKVQSRELLGEMLYLVPDHLESLVQWVEREDQDFDQAVRCLNPAPQELLERKDHRVIRIDGRYIAEPYQYNGIRFIRMQDFKDGNKYRVLPKLATIKLCGRRYLALDAVTVGVDDPIIVTLTA